MTYRMLCEVAKMMREGEEVGKKNAWQGNKRVQRRLLLDSWLYFSSSFPPVRRGTCSSPSPHQNRASIPSFQWGGGRGGRVLASPGGPSLEMTSGLEEQVAQMAWGWRGRNSLSPTNGLWVFIALGTICELKPPYFLHS